MTDEELRGTILAELAAEPLLAGREIDVLVERGRVVLRGSVITHAEKVIADRVVHRICGVKSLELGVSIRRLPRPDDDWVEDARRFAERF